MSKPKAHMAPPIFSKEKIFLSYQSNDYVAVHELSFDHIPVSQIVTKNVENPKTAYHGWLDRYRDHDVLYDAFMEARNSLMNGKRIDVSIAAAEESQLSIKKKPKVTKAKSRIATKVKETPTPDFEPVVTLQLQQKNTDLIDSTDPSAKDCEPDINSALEEKKQFVIDETLSAADLSQDVISNVFISLAVLDWCEKDDGVRNRNTLFRMTRENIATCFPIMVRLANDLYVAISATTGALAGFTIEERYNFLFHIIAKGEMMYYQTIDDPEFCLYLLEQYQPLYTYMRKELKTMPSLN